MNGDCLLRLMERWVRAASRTGGPRVVGLFCVLALSTRSPEYAEAQEVRPTFSKWVPELSAPVASLMSSNASGWRLTGGAALAQAGAAGLALVLITTCDGDDGDDGCEWSGLLTGGLASVFAVPAGVQLAGTRRTYGRLLLGSIAGIIAGWGIAEAFHSAGVEGDGLLMIVPITQIGTTVVAGL